MPRGLRKGAAEPGPIEGLAAAAKAGAVSIK